MDGSGNMQGEDVQGGPRRGGLAGERVTKDTSTIMKSTGVGRKGQGARTTMDHGAATKVQGGVTTKGKAREPLFLP